VTIYIQPCVLRRGRAQRDETQSGTEERECCAGEVEDQNGFGDVSHL